MNGYIPSKWTVEFTAKAAKARGKLPSKIKDRLDALVRAIQYDGPVQPAMPHFGKLKGLGETFHCHLNNGKPRYVAVWRVVDKSIELVEVRYVGSHENAPY
jgi:mRNA-degrading endonuclease RelE of RelBE toxin-antitoxin system